MFDSISFNIIAWASFNFMQIWHTCTSLFFFFEKYEFENFECYSGFRNNVFLRLDMGESREFYLFLRDLYKIFSHFCPKLFMYMISKYILQTSIWVLCRIETRIAYLITLAAGPKKKCYSVFFFFFEQVAKIKNSNGRIYRSIFWLSYIKFLN